MLRRLWTLRQALLRSIGRRPPPAPDAPAGPTTFAALRSAQPGGDELGAAAEAWLDQLPDHARPRRLAARHPRIVNRLAEVWGDPAAAADALDLLMIDTRGGRTGFAPTIRAELKRLQYLQRQMTADAARAQAAASAPKAAAPPPRSRRDRTDA